MNIDEALPGTVEQVVALLTGVIGMLSWGRLLMMTWFWVLIDMVWSTVWQSPGLDRLAC